MRAAVEALRMRGPAAIIVAVPVAPADTVEAFRPLVDDIVCVLQPEQLYAVGLWYADFTQTSDIEVRELLDAATYALPFEGINIQSRSTTLAGQPGGCCR
jgi:predicted phosphoribosyltransferase